MEFQFETGEVLLINKPYKWTSFDVVGKLRSVIRKCLGLKKIKIGHAGTLDPLATGLLIVCSGKFTKRIDEFQGLEKEYTGTFCLGATTPSFDLETDPENPAPYGHLTTEEIFEAANRLTGTYNQAPPLFSARKVDGKRAYTFARKKIDVEMESRTIAVSAFEIIQVHLPLVDFRVVCSKGTYIRSLARDYGQILGCGAYLATLCRTRIGPYYLRDAYEIGDIEKMIKTNTGHG